MHLNRWTLCAFSLQFALVERQFNQCTTSVGVINNQNMSLYLQNKVKQPDTYIWKVPSDGLSIGHVFVFHIAIGGCRLWNSTS